MTIVAETPYTETEALLLAMKVESEVIGKLDLIDYLEENLWPGELRSLERALDILGDAISRAKAGSQRNYEIQNPRSQEVPK